MKLAVSNIAWPAGQDAEVAAVLPSLGVSAIEVAPTRLWPKPWEVSDAEIDAVRERWRAWGLPIVAGQALLFGRPDLTLFESPAIRAQTFEYLQGIVRVCGRLGAGVLVFGSPKNRRVESRDRSAVWQEAIEFFGRLADVAVAEGTSIVMEANPPAYGADFVVRASEALDLVRAVDRSGFRLHLDSACMTMAQDDPALIVPEAAKWLAHFHASEPQLAPVGRGGVDHAAYANALKAAGYSGWVSVEMRLSEPFLLSEFAKTIETARFAYGGIG